MSEIELKFIVGAQAASSVWQKAMELGYCETVPRARSLRSIYFDTPEGALRKAGISLRLRRSGRRWIQSVKRRRGLNGGLAHSHEVEVDVPRERVLIERIDDDELRIDIAAELKGAPLIPVCETWIRRAAGDVRFENGTRAEMAVDTGEIVAGDRSAQLREIEIELVEGNAEDLFRMAKMLFPSGGLRFSRYSKGARGNMLASKGYIEPPLVPRPAEAVNIHRSETVERAARDILRECYQQIATNIRAILEMDDPEGSHQLRIGLRRLRSALSDFDPMFMAAEADRLRSEARWLGAEVGRLRDVEAVLADVVLPEAERFPDEAGFAALVTSLREDAAGRREALRQLLKEERVQSFTFDIVRFIETRGWLAALDIEQSERLAQPILEFAEKSLRKRWRKTKARARSIGTLTAEERHELRKELKKLRYLTEFFAPIFPKKRVASFLKRLKNLQTVFGQLNDAEVAQRLLETMSPKEGETAPARAAGCVIGSTRTHAEMNWLRAKALWRNLEKARPFWQ